MPARRSNTKDRKKQALPNCTISTPNSSSLVAGRFDGNCWYVSKDAKLRMAKKEKHTGNDDNGQQDNDTDNDAHAHLHVLPPHLLAYDVGSATEALRRGDKVVGLVLQSIQALTTLGNLVDIVAHDTDRLVDLLPCG